MNIFSKYIAYLKDNPKGYWFKRKAFGWGWTPVTWQGWLVTVGAVGLIVWNAFRLDVENSHDAILPFVVQSVVIVSVLIWICYKTGESPKWQWGIPEKDDTNSTSV